MFPEHLRCCLQYGGRAPETLFQTDHLQVRVVLFKPANETNIGASKTIYGLVGVADHKEVLVVLTGKRAEKTVLDCIDILKLVYEYPSIIRSVLRENLRMGIKQMNRESYQVVQINCISFA